MRVEKVKRGGVESNEAKAADSTQVEAKACRDICTLPFFPAVDGSNDTEVVLHSQRLLV